MVRAYGHSAPRGASCGKYYSDGKETVGVKKLRPDGSNYSLTKGHIFRSPDPLIDFPPTSRSRPATLGLTRVRRLQAWINSTDPEDTHAAAFLYPHPGGFLHQLSSPPSPPISDGDSHAALALDQQPLSGAQLPLANTTQVAGNCNIRSSRSGYRHPQPAMTGTAAKISSTTGQSSTLPSRPAHRILKPASEKPREYDQGTQPSTLSAHTKLKEKPETAQPRNHHLYKALPGKDGLFRCPFAKENQCVHMPTKQKCAYE